MTTNTKKETILIVDDEPENLRVLEINFKDTYDVIAVDSGKKSVAAVTENPGISAIVMDIKMADMDGIEAARAIRKISPEIPIIFHTGFPGDYDENDIDIGEKPFDYIEKLDSYTKLTRSVRNAVEYYNLKQRNLSLTAYAEAAYGMIGESPSMQKVFGIMKKIAPTDGKVMILGETGTGKELVARALHENSPRKEKRLAIYNCSRRSADLVESELFGHTRGAFTGAVAERRGLFEEANGGTVFLDEIGDLDPDTQIKILRVVETGEFKKVGSETVQHTDVRLLSATHKNLENMVSEGCFREDLYFRLSGITIALPPLRDRREDIPILVEKLKARIIAEKNLSPKILDPEAVKILTDYDWPGNVRQLQATIENLILLSESDIIMAEEVTEALKLSDESKPEKRARLSLAEQVRGFEKSRIMETLKRNNFNISASARELKIDRSNLRKKIKYYGISTPS